MSRICLEVENDTAGERLDKYLSVVLPDQSRSYLQKLIKDGQIQVNGKNAKPGMRLDESDEVTVELPELKDPEILPENIQVASRFKTWIFQHFCKSVERKRNDTNQ